MTEFTPIASFTGGMMIGLAAVLLMALNGRIAGISGILAGVLTPAKGETAWRAAFVAGLIVAPLVYRLAAGELPPFVTPHALWAMAVGGFLVGLGARMGSGCTSGHGVCGMARFSKRSIIATIVFMTSAILTVFLYNLILGVR